MLKLSENEKLLCSYSSLQLTVGLLLAWTGKQQFTESQLKDSNTRGQETAQGQSGCNLSDGRVKVFWILLLFIIFCLCLSCLRIYAGWGQPHSQAWAQVSTLKKTKRITQTFHDVELTFPYNPRLCFLNIKVLLNQLIKLQSEMLAVTQERSGPWEWVILVFRTGWFMLGLKIALLQNQGGWEYVPDILGSVWNAALGMVLTCSSPQQIKWK